MSLRLEEERRRWQSQAELASRAASEQQRQALALLDETHRTAIEFAESQITQLSDALTSERAAHQREIDERVSELAGKHAAELEEQHAWYVSQMATFEKDRDSAIDQLTTHLDTSLAALREQQREALEVERSSLDRAMARLQAEQASTMDALANESSRELAAVQETVERERRESAARLAEDQEHRARVNQADLRRLEQHTAEMRNLLVAEREQWAARETKARAHGAEVLKEVREAAYQQSTVEHDRVLREAAAHGAELTQQHEAALAAALAQKDEQARTLAPGARTHPDASQRALRRVPTRPSTPQRFPAHSNTLPRTAAASQRTPTRPTPRPSLTRAAVSPPLPPPLRCVWTAGRAPLRVRRPAGAPGDGARRAAVGDARRAGAGDRAVRGDARGAARDR